MITDTYTLVLTYRNGDVVSKSGLDLLDLYDPLVKHPTTKERPVSIKLSPVLPSRIEQEVIGTLKCKLMPGVPKGQVTYGN